jgi:hypothetical protein
VGPLMRTMKANAAWQRPLLEYNAAYLLVQLCTALCSPPSYEQMDEGNSATPNISASGEVQPLKILRRQISYLDLKETQLLATAIAKMKVPAEICRIGGPSFIQHFISIARADCQHLPTLLALTFSNLATVHMPIDPADLGNFSANIFNIVTPLNLLIRLYLRICGAYRYRSERERVPRKVEGQGSGDQEVPHAAGQPAGGAQRGGHPERPRVASNPQMPRRVHRESEPLPRLRVLPDGQRVRLASWQTSRRY